HRLLPAKLPTGWLGAMVFVLALALFAWAIATITNEVVARDANDDLAEAGGDRENARGHDPPSPIPGRARRYQRFSWNDLTMSACGGKADIGDLISRSLL